MLAHVRVRAVLESAVWRRLKRPNCTSPPGPSHCRINCCAAAGTPLMLHNPEQETSAFLFACGIWLRRTPSPNFPSRSTMLQRQRKSNARRGTLRRAVIMLSPPPKKDFRFLSNVVVEIRWINDVPNMTTAGRRPLHQQPSEAQLPENRRRTHLFLFWQLRDVVGDTFARRLVHQRNNRLVQRSRRRRLRGESRWWPSWRRRGCRRRCCGWQWPRRLCGW